MKIVFCAAMAAIGLCATAGEVKLSLQAYTFRDRSFVETIETAKRLGFANLEAYPGQRLGGDMEGTTDYGRMTPETLKKLKEYLATAPVKVVSYGVTGANDDAGWTKLMSFCRELGIGIVQIEAGQSSDYYDRAERFARECGIRVALHNHTQENGRPAPMRSSLEGRSAMIGAGADIGHWTRAGEDALAGVRLLKGRIHEIHLADVASREAGFRDVPLGSGIIDVKGVLDALKAESNDVFATVEYEHMSDALETEVGACARWFKAWARGEIGADNKLKADAWSGLWTDVTGEKPAEWELQGEYKLAFETEEKTKKMHRLELDFDQLKADNPGVNKNERAESAFGADRARKYCRDWNGSGFVSVALKEPAAVKFYTISSSNDGPERDPTKWTLLGSDDGANWTELDRRDNQLFPARFFIKGFEVKTPRPCRFLKLELQGNAGDDKMQFSRVGFFD